MVGNITIGGTGKTPFLIALIHYLHKHNLKVGVISRGYGGVKHKCPKWVEKNSLATEVGDEPLLIKQKTSVDVVVCADRVSALMMLTTDNYYDVILSDDGMQHYQLPRSLEICMVDGNRLFGNNFLLPAGPLREPISRIKSVDFIVYNGGQPPHGSFSMLLKFDRIYRLNDSSQSIPISFFDSKKIYAVAGIGHPERFFNLLETLGLKFVQCPFPDHYQYKSSDFMPMDDGVILMTEKDAVKCNLIADERFFAVEVNATIDRSLFACILSFLNNFVC